MTLARLALTDLRSYPQALVLPPPGFVILTGENGAGKTNVLEAVSLLAPGRGLRGAALSDVARSEGPGGFAVAAVLADAVRWVRETPRPAPPDLSAHRWDAIGATLAAFFDRIG